MELAVIIILTVVVAVLALAGIRRALEKPNDTAEPSSDLQRLEQELSDQRAAAELAESELAKAREERAALRAQGESLQAVVVSLTADRDEWRHSSEANATSLSTAVADLEASRASFEQQSKAVADRDKAIKSSAELNAQLRAELDRILEELAKSREAHAKAHAEAEERSKMLARRMHELTQARESLQQTSALLSDRETELEGIRAADATRREELEKQLADLDRRFKGIAAEVAKTSNEEFRKAAADDFKKQRDLAEQQLKQQVEPVGKELEQLRKYVGELEKQRTGAYEGVTKLVQETQQRVNELRGDTTDLREILRSSQHRGRWGEATLENILELAGMRRGIDFLTQVGGERGTGIADVVVRMPGGKRLIVDSKVPFEEYRQALEVDEPAEQQIILTRHAERVLATAAGLRKDDYESQFDGSLDFVVMWIPTDSILEGATRVMPNLIEESFQRHRVLLATPVTMIALLSGVAAAIHQEEQQEKLHKNALEIQQAGERLYNGVRRHAAAYQALGNRLNSTIQAYDAGVSSIQGNLLQGAKQMRELGGGEGEEPPDLEELRVQTRSFRSKELLGLPTPDSTVRSEPLDQSQPQDASVDSVPGKADSPSTRQSELRQGADGIRPYEDIVGGTYPEASALGREVRGTSDSADSLTLPTRARASARSRSSRPNGFTLWGQTHEARGFRGVLQGVADEIHDRHADDFDRAFQIRGRTRQYVTSSPGDHIMPLQVNDSSYWIEGNQSGKNAISICQRLLEHFGHKANDLIVHYPET